MNYEDFIAQKEKQSLGSGIKPKNLNKKLFDFQAEIVSESLEKARYANFADCGLGKTAMQLEWANQIVQAKNKPVLVLTPLAVAQQTIEEGEKFGIEVHKHSEGKGKIHVANYEQLDNIDCSKYIGVVLDESSILKNFEGKTKQKIIETFARTEFKLPCTATPSPNDPMELGNHSEFLNILLRNEMLSMYFVYDGGETSKWRLKKHGTHPFYKWISGWAMLITKPSDLGYNDGDFVLPKLEVTEHKIETENEGNSLFNDMAVSATQFNKELRRTITERMERVAETVNDTKEPFIVWVKQDVEADYLMKIIPDAQEVRGSMPVEEKEKKLIGFKHNNFRVLITKPKIGQYGLNYQHCNNQFFPSPDFSFESLYQAIRRSYRFGQKKDVNIHIAKTDTMSNVIASIKQKEIQWKEMIQQMNLIRKINAN